MTVERILKLKGFHSPTISPAAKISEVIEMLDREEEGAIVVSADGKNIDGIITEHDVVHSLCRFGLEVLEKTVRDVMTKDVITCTADDRVVGVMAVMAEKRIRHVPVIEDGKLAAIVNIGDIIQLRLNEVQAEADAMRNYIARA